MLWLYLHFPSLQLDTLFNSELSNSEKVHSNEESHEQPIIIVDEKDHRVLQANPAALQSGNFTWYGARVCGGALP